MPGMMTEEELADLDAASGPEFEDMWLEMMIEHHEGAIEMAKDEQADGVFQPAIDLAESIEPASRPRSTTCGNSSARDRRDVAGRASAGHSLSAARRCATGGHPPRSPSGQPQALAVIAVPRDVSASSRAGTPQDRCRRGPVVRPGSAPRSR